MRHRACWVVGVFVVLRCATVVIVPHPSPEHPIPMCAISCADGREPQFARQHLCLGGSSRFFADFFATGEYVERNVDGTIKIAVWTSRDGDYDKSKVEMMRCSEYVHQMISSRVAEQRGQFPGETEDGHPAPPH